MRGISTNASSASGCRILPTFSPADGAYGPPPDPPPTTTTVVKLDWIEDVANITSGGGGSIESGQYIGTWVTTDGSLLDFANSGKREADFGPNYVTESGVGQDGTGNAAIGWSTPRIVPAATPFVMYLRAYITQEDGMLYISDSATGHYMYLHAPNGGNPAQAFISIHDEGSGGGALSKAITGATSIDSEIVCRWTREAGGVWRLAATGMGDTTVGFAGSNPQAGFSFDTLCAYGTGGTLVVFGNPGVMLRSMYVRYGSDAPDLAWEAAHGGVL